MDATCRKCAAKLEASWKFCPQCGATQVAPINHSLPEHHDAEKAPVKSAFGGLLLGLVAAPVLIIWGGMICLTGLGVFLGVPLVIAGVCAPLLGSLMGMNALKGKCPWCGCSVGSVAIFDRFSCPACSKRIVVRKSELVRAS
ncbi:MAG TPA: zinc-ribbon domain-containing protein [Terracidiphilus sp.]|nr:zinc-ribbon domain-containing protein [Terracidiphilus sp.]